jgi:hypothetical protein
MSTYRQFLKGRLLGGRMIPIEVRSKTEAMEGAVRQFAERRMSFALDRLRNVQQIAVSIEDVNGPKGGIDKHCRIFAEFGFASIVIDETQPSWQSAVTHAIRRLVRTATEEMQRVNWSSSRSRRRTRPKVSRREVNFR